MLKAYRIDQGLTLGELSSEVGIPLSTLAGILKKQRVPDGSVMAKLVLWTFSPVPVEKRTRRG